MSLLFYAALYCIRDCILAPLPKALVLSDLQVTNYLKENSFGVGFTHLLRNIIILIRGSMYTAILDPVHLVARIRWRDTVAFMVCFKYKIQIYRTVSTM